MIEDNCDILLFLSKNEMKHYIDALEYGVNIEQSERRKERWEQHVSGNQNLVLKKS